MGSVTYLAGRISNYRISEENKMNGNNTYDGRQRCCKCNEPFDQLHEIFGL